MSAQSPPPWQRAPRSLEAGLFSIGSDDLLLELTVPASGFLLRQLAVREVFV